MCRAAAISSCAAEHGNFAHLHQVDADRIVDLVVVAGQFFPAGVFQAGRQVRFRFLVLFPFEAAQVVVEHFRLVVQFFAGGILGTPAASPPADACRTRFLTVFFDGSGLEAALDMADSSQGAGTAGSGWKDCRTSTDAA